MSSTGVNTPLTISTFYNYTPVLGILVAAAIIFGLQAIILTYQSIRSRSLFLVWLVVFAAAEAGGYVAFCVFVQSPSLGGYLAELILIILAPNFVTLVNYVVISRIIPWSGYDKSSWLARRGHLVPTIFLTSDILCLILQSIGGSQLSASHHDGIVDENKFNLGREFTLAGISAQLGFQSLFGLLAIYIYRTMPDRGVKRELRWAWLCMLITMVLVCMRNIYRIVEFAGGQNSAIDQTGAPYFVLDTLLMVLTGCTFCVLNLGADWVLPERVRRAALLETGADRQNEQAKEMDLEKGDTRAVEMMHTETTVQVRPQDSPTP